MEDVCESDRIKIKKKKTMEDEVGETEQKAFLYN